MDLTTSEELQAKKAFDTQAPLFDDLYSSNPIIQYKRARVRDVALKALKPGARILELNAGTGEDAIFFTQNGFFVHATDISEGMQNILKSKVKDSGLERLVTTEICSFTELQALKNKGPYDMIFSNFAGLNCTDRLDKVLLLFSDLLTPNGIIVLTILPPFCLWEMMVALKGDFKTAFRRFFASKGAAAKIEDVNFKCWYYKPSFVIGTLKRDFSLLTHEGLCAIVPPSYMEKFPFKYPTIYKKLTELEDRFRSSWPWKNIGDYYVISFRKRT